MKGFFSARPTIAEEVYLPAAAQRGRGTLGCAIATATRGSGLTSTRQQPEWFDSALCSRSGRRRRGASRGTRATVPQDRDTAHRAVVGLRGGDASSSSSSSSSSSGIKGDAKGATKEKDDASWGLNLNVFGWGGDSEAEAEAKAEKKRKAKQDMEEAEAREAMRKAREERCG